MSKACEAIWEAVSMVREGKDPKLAWKIALEITDWKGKPCARAAFLGLCTEGMIAGCNKGKYSRGKKNKEYAIKALQYLMEHPEAANLTPNELWKKAAVSDTLMKQTGYQMDVALIVFKNCFFNKENVESYAM